MDETDDKVNGLNYVIWPILYVFCSVGCEQSNEILYYANVAYRMGRKHVARKMGRPPAMWRTSVDEASLKPADRRINGLHLFR